MEAIRLPMVLPVAAAALGWAELFLFISGAQLFFMMAFH
jgi:hypothetical protein